jgi:DNA ligase (NAD+)
MVDETTNRISNRIALLRRKIEAYNEAYYVQHQPIVPDVIYDEVFRELQQLENQHPDAVENLTNRVSGRASSDFDKIHHGFPMLSIKTQTEPTIENIKAFVRAALAEGCSPEFILEHKYDGLGLSNIYSKGKLDYSVTRGDGIVGEDVGYNATYCPDIPFDLDFNPTTGCKHVGFIEIRGEVLLSKAAFENINKQRVEKGEKLYVNPRNAAAGILRTKEPVIENLKQLLFMPYGVGRVLDFENLIMKEGKPGDFWQSQDELLNWLELTVGVAIPRYVIKDATGSVEALADQILKRFEIIGKNRDSLAYEIDGVVLKLNRFEDQEKMGFVTREPRWAVALKFDAQEQVTVLKAITVQVGRTGVLTPVARLNPVFVGGTTVSNVTLHNVFDLRNRGIRVGDTVVVRRAGDVIPEITMPVLEYRQGYLKNFHMPKTCPVCGGKVFREKGDRKYYCMNRMGCRAQLKAALEHFVSKKAMAIDGLGEKLIAQMVDWGIVENAYDIYQLNEKKLSKIEGLAQKSTAKLLLAIDASRNTQLWRLIHAIGIPGVGESLSKLLAKNFPHMAPLANAGIDELKAIEGIGDVKAKSIHDYFREPANSGQATALAFYCVKAYPEEGAITNSNRLEGKTFAVTGTFPTLSRDELKERIQSNGGKVSSSVSKKTDFVVAGEGGGGKRADAEKLGIPVIGEEEFLAMI